MLSRHLFGRKLRSDSGISDTSTSGPSEPHAPSNAKRRPPIYSHRRVTSAACIGHAWQGWRMIREMQMLTLTRPRDCRNSLLAHYLSLGTGCRNHSHTLLNNVFSPLSARISLDQHGRPLCKQSCWIFTGGRCALGTTGTGVDEWQCAGIQAIGQ